MKVIILNGSNNSGKDHFANYFKKNYKYDCVNWSTVDTVKKVAKRYFDWNGEKVDESRKFLSDIKKAWSEFNNGSFVEMTNRIAKHQNKLDKKVRDKAVYFVHCREPHEIQSFVNFYKDSCITLILRRENGPDVSNNDSDKNVENFNYDFVINNNDDKKDLKKKTIDFISKIKKDE